jgi:hypothetical protein
MLKPENNIEAKDESIVGENEQVQAIGLTNNIKSSGRARVMGNKQS